MEVNELVAKSYANSVAKGFKDPAPSIPELLVLVHSELSEALEEHRNGREPTEIYFNPEKPDKPEGIPIEIADAVIRLADLCGQFRIDLAEAIRIKQAYNATRPFKHGGKVL